MFEEEIQIKAQDAQHKQEQLKRQLHLYYKHFFPHQLMFDWLSYGDKNKMHNREFSFEQQIFDDMEPIYARYKSYREPVEFQKELMGEAEQSNILKIDIGAIFDTKPTKNGKCIAIEKELVIDIDMTDYDDVRTCCEGGKICPKCWKFLKVAAEVLYKTLTDDFGFQDILWIYSGRRGIHLWVCDEHVRDMQNTLRKSIICYLQLNIGSDKNEETIKRTSSHPYHPSVERALAIADKLFDEIIINDQPGSLLKILDKIKLVLASRNNFEIPGSYQGSKPLKKNEQDIARNQKCAEFNNARNTTNQEIWANIKTIFKFYSGVDQIKLMCLYPRLDENVSKTINHLLKAPFSIHPKTGNVCTPFTYAQFKDFDPFSVPKIEDLTSSLDKFDSQSKQMLPNGLYPCLAKSTTLGRYVQIFEDFLAGVRRNQLKKNQLFEKEQF